MRTVAYLLVVLLAIILSTITAEGQTNYRSNTTTGNWNTAASWQSFNGSTWVAAANYPGQAATGTVTIRDGHTITINVSPANTITSLVVGEGASGSLTTNNTNYTLNVTTLTLTANSTFNLRRLTLTVGGASTINGDVTDNNDNGTNTFTGLVTIGSTGSITTTNASTFNFRGGITNNGTIDLTGGNDVNFTTNNQTISGTGTITVDGVVTVTTIIVTNGNTDFNMTGTAAGTLAGNGTWRQGTSGVLKYSGSTITLTNLDFNTNVNTVNYNLAGTQTIRATPYQNLTVSGSGTKTLAGATTVNNNLDISGTATLACDIYQITGNATGTLTMATGTTLALGRTSNATNVAFPTNFTNANIILNSGSTVAYQSSGAQTISSTPTYGGLSALTGNTKTAAGNLTVTGNLIVTAATLNLGTTATTLDVSGTTAISSGGNLTFNGTTTKTVTLIGSLSGNGTINMSGGSLLHNLVLGGASNAIGTFTTAAVASTVTYNRAGAQGVFGSTNYRNLTTSGSGTKSMSATVTVNGTFTIGSGTTFDPAGASLTASGNSVINGTFAESNTGGTNNFQSVDLSGGTINGSVTDVTNIAGNLTMPNGNGIIGQTTLTVTGTTTVATGRSLTLNNNSGVKTFVGKVTVDGSGSWNSTTITTANNLVFRGGIEVTTASGSFQTGVVTFNTNSQSITGAGPFTFGGAVTITGAITVTNTNTNGLTFNNTINGSVAGSTYRNGTNGITYYQPAAATQPMNTGTLDASLSGNFFYYSRAGAQNIKVPSTSYYNLYLTGGSSAVKTLQGATDVDGDFMLAASTNFDPAANDFTVTGTSTIAGVFADANATGTSTLDDVDLSGGTIDNAAASGVVNIGGNLTMPSGTGTIGRVTLTTTGTTVIATGRTLTFNANSNTGVKTFVGVITINGTGTWTSTNVSTGTNMIIRGGIDVVSSSGSFAAGAVTFNTNSQTLTGAGTISFANPVVITGAIVVTNTNTNGITFTNTIDGTVAGSTWRNGANGITYYQPAVATQPMNTGALDMSASGNYFYYSRAGAQSIKVPATSYYNLNLTGGGSALKSLQGATSVSNDFTLAASTNFDPGANTFTVSGTSYIGGVFIDGNATGNSNLNHVDLSGGTIDNAAVTGVVNIGGNLTLPTSDGIIGRVTLTTTGTTTIATGRTLTFNTNSNNGVKTFVGVITINGTGVWTSTNVSTGTNMILRGGIDVVNAAGSFAAGAVTFNTNSQSLTGAGTISFANPVSITGAIVVTNTNTNGITFTNTLDGTVAGSTWRNGAGGVTYYQPGAATQPMNTGALDMSANGNYFHYSRAGAQSIKAPSTTYYHLTLSGSGAKTLQANTTLSGNLSVAASTSIDVATFNLTVGGTTALNGTFTDASTSGTNTFTGMLTISGTGNLSTSFNSPFVFEGGITNNGTFNQTGTGAVSFNTNNQDIDGTAAINFAGAITIGASRIVTYKNTSTAGATLTAVLNGTNASSTWKNDVNSTVYYRPAVNTAPMVTGILDVSASGNNFYYSRAGAQTLKMPAGGYYNLIIDGGGSVTKILGGNTVVNGDLTIAAATTLDVDAAQSYSLDVKGDWINSGTFQARSGTVTLSGSSDQAVTTNNNNFYNLVIANTATEVTINDNVTVGNILTLTDGVVTTGANRVIVTSSSPGAVTGYSSASFVNGYLRRNFASNTGTYGFPVGNGTASANYFLAEILNNQLTGITFIDARFKPLSNHNDSQLNVYDIWEDGGLVYTSMNTTGVWELEPNTTPSSGLYTVKLYIANIPGLSDNEFAVLKRPVGSVSGADWSTGGGTLNPNDSPGRTVASGYAKRSGLSSFSEFGAGQGPGIGVGLPIELLSFTATVEQETVKLDWLTATEVNNDFFTIERSQDGETFETLAVVEGAGNSSVTQAYHTYDSKPYIGTSYYRLEQTDFDGKSTYSHVVSVTIQQTETTFNVYPNPVTNGQFFIDLANSPHAETTGVMELINAVGIKVYSRSFTTHGSGALRIELPATVSPGFYFVAVQLHDKRFTQRVLIGTH